MSNGTSPKEFYEALEKLSKDTGKSIFEVLNDYPHMRDWQRKIVESSRDGIFESKKEVLQD